MSSQALRMLVTVLLGMVFSAAGRPAVAASGLAAASPWRAGADVQPMLAALDSPRGVCAILGDGAADLALELARASELLVYVQLPAAQDVDAARRAALAAGLLNRRVYIDQGAEARIHLADNLADLVVVRGEAGGRIASQEVLRVLRPGGKGLTGTTTVVKPMPEGVDDWSHPYHGPDNNPQSTDRIARAPYLTQFLAEPWYCPMPEVTVASGGRVFKAFGNRAFKRPQWPMLNTLIAMNGYNGTILWTRQLDPDFMIHRNTMIATPETLYLADQVSCKLFDAATGAPKDEIKAPAAVCDGPVWKWMALDGGVLYALAGEKEPPGDKLAGTAFRGAGWPWWEIPKYGWGFGRTILAIDPRTKTVLWHHREAEALDTRAMCMKGGRIYFLSPRKFLGCLDARTGAVLWKTEDPQVLGPIADQRPAQRAVWGFATTAYAKCSDDALYFAGPQQTKLVAVAPGDGKLLWQYPADGNFQLVIRDDALYAMGSDHPSRKFDRLTGSTLLQLPQRTSCTRATGGVDRVFVRGRGTKCWDVAADKGLDLTPMRPACHDGVVIAGGQLYWGPWMCGCNLSLIGVICLGPSGSFNYSRKATEADRLQRPADAPAQPAALPEAPGDWPTYRKDNARRACSPVAVASEVAVRWQSEPRAGHVPTAPVAVGGLVFVSGSDGIVRALEAADGKERWTACTGGAATYSPAIAEGRALVGSADGWVYAFEAASGRLLWRFRGAPVERKIPVYGSLASTWPVGAGVLVADGVAYVAAGIANYDGTHMYALDAATGKIRWQNNNSGNTVGGQGASVSVQGHLLLNDGKVYLAGGNAVAVASYGVADGQFQPVQAKPFGSDRRGPRGKDLFLRQDGSVAAAGLFPFYSRPDDFHYIEQAELVGPSGTIDVAAGSVRLLRPGAGAQAKPVWAAKPFPENAAVAVARNAVVVAGVDRRFETPDAPPQETYGVAAVSLEDGRLLWQHSLPAGPVSWGIAIDRDGRILIAVRDGRILCLAPKG